eukprot:10598694-Alexandrium_andersonii.AAC.1
MCIRDSTLPPGHSAALSAHPRSRRSRLHRSRGRPCLWRPGRARRPHGASERALSSRVGRGP